MPTLEDAIQALPVMLAADLAGGDQFIVRDVSAETVETMTYDQLLAALNAQYAPVASIRASGFVLSSGAATAGAYTDTSTWVFADALTQTIAGRIPASDLGSFVGLSPTVRLRWFASSGSGSVYWRADMRSSATGVSMDTAPTTIIQGAHASSGVNEVAFDIGVVPITANTDLAIRVFRIGADAGDTLAASASFIGIDLVRP